MLFKLSMAVDIAGCLGNHMSLRFKFLCVGLPALIIPWINYLYIQKMEGALRDGLERSALVEATRIAQALATPEFALAGLPSETQTPEDSESDRQTIYAHPLSSTPEIDGRRDDWVPNINFGSTSGEEYQYWAGVKDRNLYLFINVIDEPNQIFWNPQKEIGGDRVLLHLGARDRFLVFSTSAANSIVRPRYTFPEGFRPLPLSQNVELRSLGYFRDRDAQDGFSLELQVPLDLVGETFGLAIIDVDADPNEEDGFRRTRTEDLLPNFWKSADDFLFSKRQRIPRFLHQPADLHDLATNRFGRPDRRLRFVDYNGWVSFDGGQPATIADIISGEPPIDGTTFPELVVGWVLRRGDSSYRKIEDPPGHIADEALREALEGQESVVWYRRETNSSATLAAAAPIYATDGTGIQGAVILEQGSEYLTLADAELVRFMGLTLLISLVIVVFLASYSARLAGRIRRLAGAAETVLSPEGEIAFDMPGRKTYDEIGGLARSFNTVLESLYEYTDYLRTLKRTLVHELRTPLSKIFTSLENLEHEPASDLQLRYLKRLRRGTEHLENILNRMAEANQVERTIEDEPKEVVDLKQVLEGAIKTYRDIHADRVFEWQCTLSSATILGSPDLMIQMLDKLVNNAVDFSPPGSKIGVELKKTDKELCISISNRGPVLPQTMRDKLFDSLVSVREGNREGEHLGLGLYIVGLIVEFHEGRRRADNLPDGSGVIFKIYLPVMSS